MKHGAHCVLFCDVTMVGLLQHYCESMQDFMKDALSLRSYELKVQYITAVRDKCSDPKR
jgi:hypothetical protein